MLCAFNLIQLIWLILQKPILEGHQSLECVLRVESFPMHSDLWNFVEANDFLDSFPVIDEGIEIDLRPWFLNNEEACLFWLDFLFWHTKLD